MNPPKSDYTVDIYKDHSVFKIKRRSIKVNNDELDMLKTMLDEVLEKLKDE